MERKNHFEKGNQYARKHGFYSKVLDEAQKKDFEQATRVEGLDEEIALLRVKIKSVVEHDPENVELITKAINALTRMMMARGDFAKDDEGGVAKAIGKVLDNIVVPAGILIGNIIKR